MENIQSSCIRPVFLSEILFHASIVEKHGRPMPAMSAQSERALPVRSCCTLED